MTTDKDSNSGFGKGRTKMKCLMFLLAAGLSLTAVSAGKIIVFVSKFECNDSYKIDDSDIQILHDRIVGNVVSSRKYEVVARENLAKIQQELKLVDAGLTEGDAPQSNKLKAAGYCIYGKILQYRSSERSASLEGVTLKRVDGLIEIQIRIASVETGRIVAAKTVKAAASRTMSNALASTQDIRQEVMADAVDKAARLVVERLNDIAFPVYVLSAKQRFVTANVAEEQVTEGEVWEAFALGDELKDPQTGDSLGFDEELIASVRVSRPGPKTTKFEYGADESSAEKSKEAILAAKSDGEKIILRKMRIQPIKKPNNNPDTSGVRGMR